MTSGHPNEHIADDEITIDPEATSAADADWLAELRERARRGGTSVADMLSASGETESSSHRAPTHVDDQVDADDEVTIDHRGGIDAVREAVDDVQRNAAPLAPPTAATTSTAVPEASARSHVARPAPADDTPAVPTPPAHDRDRPPADESTLARWEAPARLDTGSRPPPPALLGARERTDGRRWRIIAAVAVALVVGFILSFFIFGDSADAPVDDPSITTIPSFDDEPTVDDAEDDSP